MKYLLIAIVGLLLPACAPSKVLVKKCSEQDKDGYRICEKA